MKVLPRSLRYKLLDGDSNHPIIINAKLGKNKIEKLHVIRIEL